MLWFDFIQILNWLIYYYAVKLEYYAYGEYGLRYALFFLVLWFVWFPLAVSELISGLDILLEKRLKSYKSKYLSAFVYLGITGFFVYYFFTGWSTLNVEWPKEDIRGVVQYWYDNNLDEANTLVYYGADTGFSYYVSHNPRYNDERLKNVKLMNWYRDWDKERYWDYISNEVYCGELPEQVYVIASHYRDDLDEILDGFASDGYIEEVVCERKYAKIIKCTRERGITID